MFKIVCLMFKSSGLKVNKTGNRGFYLISCSTLPVRFIAAFHETQYVLQMTSSISTASEPLRH